MPKYAAPGQAGSVVSYRPRYDHYIGGEYVPPATGKYFENPTPITGEVFTEIARGTAEDVDRAVTVAEGASAAWGRTSAAERAAVLNKIADRMEQNLEMLAVAESWENGKPVRETLAADIRWLRAPVYPLRPGPSCLPTSAAANFRNAIPHRPIPPRRCPVVKVSDG